MLTQAVKEFPLQVELLGNPFVLELHLVLHPLLEVKPLLLGNLDGFLVVLIDFEEGLQLVCDPLGLLVFLAQVLGHDLLIFICRAQ